MRPKEITVDNKSQVKALSLLSGGLDSRLAVLVLQKQSIHVEGVVFNSPFFDISSAKEAAEQLKVKLHIVDFTEDIISLIKAPRHGFGGGMNPCIDCHARMIHRAGELMEELGFDFVATGEVMGQRPMSQNRNALAIVERDSELGGKVVRPLSAKLLPPTQPELDGKLDRERLLDLSGRNRKPQLALAREFGLDRWPSPAGGCLLTEKRYTQRLRDLAEHEGLDDIFAIRLLKLGRHFRLPDGARLVVGRDARNNLQLKKLRREGDLLLHTVNVPGPTVLIPGRPSSADLDLAVELCAAYGDHDRSSEVTVRVVTSDGSSDRTITAKDKSDFACFML